MRATPPDQPARPANTALQVFTVGDVYVTVLAPCGDGLARYLLHRSKPPSTKQVLIGSGSTEDAATCIEQAVTAARRVRCLG